MDGDATEQLTNQTIDGSGEGVAVAVVRQRYGINGSHGGGRTTTKTAGASDNEQH